MLIRIMRIAVLTFAATALVFLLLSLLSGLLSLPYVDDFGIWIPLTIFLACLAGGIWLVAGDHLVSKRTTLIAVIGGIAISVVGIYLVDNGPFDEDYAVYAALSAVFAVLAGLACQAVISWGKWGVAASVLVFAVLSFFVWGSLGMSYRGVDDALSGALVEAAGDASSDDDWHPPPPTPPPPLGPAGDGNTDSLPNYQWPPETPSWTYSVMRGSDENAASLYDISDRLYFALLAADYFESSYYRAPGGFVLVTRLEAIDSDGSPLRGGRRFQLPDDDRDFEFAEYIRSLFFAPTGHYRFIAFVVTDKPFVASPEILSDTTAVTRLQEGATALPTNFWDIPFSSNHRVDALIYEFRKAGTNSDVETLVPGRVSPNSHLIRSGLYSALQENLL